MKKSAIRSIITIALVAILFSCLSFSCFAAETSHIHQPQMSASHAVYVRVIYNIDGKADYYKSDDYNEQGQYYTVTTPDGITFRVYYPKGGLTLVIHEIKEEAPLSWFNSLFPECKSITPYEIFFLNEWGGRVNLPDGIKIEIEGALPQEVMTLLNTKEQKTRLDAKVVDGVLTFYSSADADYYVLGMLKPQLAPTLPQTGDDSFIALWIAIMALSIMGIMIIAAFLLRPRDEDEEEAEDESAHRSAPCEGEDEAQRTAPCENEGGDRRRGQKNLSEIPKEMNCYLNEVEERPPDRGGTTIT